MKERESGRGSKTCRCEFRRILALSEQLLNWIPTLVWTHTGHINLSEDMSCTMLDNTPILNEHAETIIMFSKRIGLM